MERPWATQLGVPLSIGLDSREGGSEDGSQVPRRANTEVGVCLVTKSEAPVGQSSRAVGACEETGGTVSSGAVMSHGSGWDSSGMCAD